MYECKIVLNSEFWTMIASLIAAAALVASVMSIKASREIDKNNAARVRDRERRDAIPLATAIQHEVHRALGFCNNVQVLQTLIPDNPEVVCRRLVAERDRVLPETLIENIAALRCFDAQTGKKIAGALTMARTVHGSLNVDDEFIRSSAADILQAVTKLCANVRQAFVDTELALSDYTNIRATSTI